MRGLTFNIPINRKFVSKLVVFSLVVATLSSSTQAFAQPILSQPSGQNTHISEYMQANWNAALARNIPYPSKTKLMVLHGTWNQMGQQYGEQSGDYIRIVYDTMYGLFLSSGLPPEKLGPVLNTFMSQTNNLSPEMVDFVRGIGQGAAPQLNQADHANALTNAQKIMFLNSLFEVAFPNSWTELAHLMGVPPPQPTANEVQFASHAWAAWGNMTKDGHTIMGGTRDQPWFPTMYNVSYVAIPSDHRAAKTWGNAIAGTVASSSQVNEHGVGIGNTIADAKEQQLGVPVLLSTAYISFFAHSAREAVDIYTIGTPEYRQKTGRKTLASTAGFLQAFADKNKGFVVERTGRNFAIRKSDDMGEQGNYLTLANHTLSPNSFDENRHPTGLPMSNWTVGYPDESSLDRFWALYYELAHNKGTVSPTFGRDTIAKLKYYYTPSGQKVTEKDGTPAWRLGLTPERWLIPNPSDPNSFPTGGNNMYFVSDLTNKEISWEQGIPSHWSGAWEHVSLDDPAWNCFEHAHKPESTCKVPVY